MLEKLDLTKKISKTEYKERMLELMPKMGRLQRECRELEIPVMIAFEGYGASGKGVQIGELIRSLDPRGFTVYAVKNETEDEKMHPFLWRFWTKMPEKGRIAIYDSTWYRKVLVDRFEKRTKRKELPAAYESIRSFERQITDDGMVLVKIFLVIDKKEQKKRFRKLLASEESAWRVKEEELRRNKEFERFEKMNEEMLEETDTAYAPWNLIEAVDRRYAAVKVYETVVRMVEEAVLRKKEGRENGQRSAEDTAVNEDVLSGVDLTLSYTKDEYKVRLERLQNRMEKLHGELYRRRIPVVLGFEGWDAGGKGGAIKRLTEKMDPRGYVVHPTASPDATERKYHYLWRFWKNMPKAGHVAIFDRTWYGRVMVERLEGFCSENDWMRAYNEINEFEKELHDWGAVIIKFWVQIDKDTQLARFTDRQNTPEKQWKITDEDWRNREKWDEYETAVNEMIAKTSTTYAPWHILESVDKKYARIKALKIVIHE
ncbi:MAG: polyphosphate:AMP phosphotransferase, partial [Lachnoclostridium sp.]|nr:polyphosphate:AMP phosphotransferase [Lachnoclostridium sp.]